MAASDSTLILKARQPHLPLRLVNILLHLIHASTSKPSTPIIRFIIISYAFCLLAFLRVFHFTVVCFFNVERLCTIINFELQSFFRSSKFQLSLLLLYYYNAFALCILATSVIIRTFVNTLASLFILPRPVPLSSQPVFVRFCLLACAIVCISCFAFVSFR